jgi:hypothetical protein
MSPLVWVLLLAFGSIVIALLAYLYVVYKYYWWGKQKDEKKKVRKGNGN